MYTTITPIPGKEDDYRIKEADLELCNFYKVLNNWVENSDKQNITTILSKHLYKFNI